MKKRIYYLFGLLCICLFNLNAQVAGTVIDEHHNPIEFVNVALYSSIDSTLIGGAATDSLGLFSIPADNVENTFLKLSIIGYETKIINTEKNQTIILQPSTTELSEIVIRADQPLIRAVEDKIIFNVQNLRNIEGYNASDILKLVPKVFVGNDEAIMIGNIPATLFVNNRRLSADEAKIFLQTMQANAIANIEIRETHGSEQDASIRGSIINIRTKGINRGFESTTSLRFEKPASEIQRINPSLNIQGGSGKFSFYGSYSLSHFQDNQYSETTNNFINNDTKHFSKGNYKTNRLSNFFRTGITFNPNKNHSLGIECNGNFSKAIDNPSTYNILLFESNNIIDKGNILGNNNSDSKFLNLVFNYNWIVDSLGSRLNVLTNYNNRNMISSIKREIQYEILPNFNAANTATNFADNISLKVDFEKIYSSKLSLRTGAQYSSTNRFSKNKAEEDSRISVENRWNYDEVIFGVYAGLSKSFEGNLFIIANIRAENTVIDGKANNREHPVHQNHTQFFPYFYFSHQPSDNFSYNLFYTKNINRPAFSLLNNYSYRVTDILYTQGNPNLKPELENIVQVSANYLNHKFSLRYKYTPNTITEQFQVIDNIVYHSNVNFGVSRILESDYSFSGKIKDWWQTNFYLFAGYTHIPQSYYKKKLLSGFASMNNRVFVFNKGILSIELYARTGRILGNSYYGGTSGMNISFSKSIFNNALTIAGGINDIFNSTQNKSITQTPYLNYSFYSKNQTRYMWLRLSYRISSKTNVKIKRIDNVNTIQDRL